MRQTSNPAYLYAPTAGSQTITRNGLNQPTAVNSAAASSDARGNLTSDGVRSFVYDSANRLTGAGSSTLAYDPLDRMTQMVGTLGARYLYDGDEIAGVVAASTGTTIANRIVRGPWPDELLVAYQGNTASTPLWSLQDHQSSIIAITDAAGGAPYTLGYDEYGQPRSGNAGRLMYTGQLWLPDFGLYHYKARAYHPGLGRFVQTDPVGYAQGMNLYAYVGLDPVNKTDPTGMIGQDRNPMLPPPNPEQIEQVRAVVEVVVDFLPIIGDVKGGLEFFADPSWGGAAILGISLIPGGDIVKYGDEAFDLLKDGMKLGTNDALETSLSILGDGYSEVASGVFRSSDGRF